MPDPDDTSVDPVDPADLPPPPPAGDPFAVDPGSDLPPGAEPASTGTDPAYDPGDAPLPGADDELDEYR